MQVNWKYLVPLFEEFSSWLRTFLSSVKVPMKDVAESYDLIGDQMRAVLDADEAELVITALARGRKKLLETEGTLSIPACETTLDSMAATQLVMSQLYPYLFTGEKKNKKMITTCVPGELHEMGARMVNFHANRYEDTRWRLPVQSGAGTLETDRRRWFCIRYSGCCRHSRKTNGSLK